MNDESRLEMESAHVEIIDNGFPVFGLSWSDHSIHFAITGGIWVKSRAFNHEHFLGRFSQPS